MFLLPTTDAFFSLCMNLQMLLNNVPTAAKTTLQMFSKCLESCWLVLSSYTWLLVPEWFTNEKELGGLPLKLNSYILLCDHVIWEDWQSLIKRAWDFNLKICFRRGTKEIDVEVGVYLLLWWIVKQSEEDTNVELFSKSNDGIYSNNTFKAGGTLQVTTTFKVGGYTWIKWTMFVIRNRDLVQKHWVQDMVSRHII